MALAIYIPFPGDDSNSTNQELVSDTDQLSNSQSSQVPIELDVKNEMWPLKRTTSLQLAHSHSVWRM